jgi:GntR family histidine utilization transcriptional repressor
VSDGFTLDGDGPLYAQIERAVVGAVIGGDLRPGDRLPSEAEFTALFGASRMTVNRALRALADDGLVVRKRRGGTFVAKPVQNHAVLAIADIRDEIESGGSAYGYELLSAHTARAVKAVAEPLGLKAGAKVIHVRCRHLADGVPVVLEDRGINPAAAPGVDTAAFAETSPNAWLLETVPWSRADVGVSAVAADADLADALAIAPGTPCLQVDRTTWLGDQGVTRVHLTYPGDKHRLTARVLRSAYAD